MKASFQYALRYWVQVTCRSPFRTAGTDNDTQLVLRRWDGTPFMQGSSVAGAMRSWKDNDTLFGSQSKEGTLIVSDLVFDSDASAAQRPRLRIDKKTGTGADGGKFDVTSLCTGTSGAFTLVWRGSDEPEQAAKQITEYLCAMQNGEILFGAQKTNGFGRLNLQVKCRKYDMKSAYDRTCWLEEKEDGHTVTLASGQLKKIHLCVEAQMYQLLIKAVGADGVGENSVDAPPMTENGKLIIPGSSIKGVLRAQVQRLIPACLGVSEEKAEARTDQIFGRGAGENDNGMCGNAQISEGRFEDTVKPEAFPKATRIRINRLTGGVQRGALFSERPVAGLCRWDISLPAEKEADAMLLLFALRDMGLGLYNLGSGNSIGHGRMDLLTVTVETPAGEKARLVCSPDAVIPEDSTGLFQRWMDKMKGAEQ